MAGNLRERWEVDIDRGPDWLFVRLHPGKASPDDLAERVWSAADRHFVYRLVLEMDDVEFLPSPLMGQLVMLQKRAIQHAGALRLSGLSDDCADALHMCRLDRALPNFPSREEAVVGVRRERAQPSEAFRTSLSEKGS
jgi:anti-anti-sigma factor